MSDSSKKVYAKRKYAVSLGQDFLAQYLNLLHDWDFGKNGSIGVSDNNKETGLDKTVWWRCDAGHSWQATVNETIACNGVCSLCEAKAKKQGGKKK